MIMIDGDRKLTIKGRQRISGDMLYDERTGRGDEYDQTQRLRGYRFYRSAYEYRRLYESNGFIQNIIAQPANDATREWITVTTNRDEDLKINRLIEERLEELGLQKKIRDLIKYSRMYAKGSLMYFGVLGAVPQNPDILMTPMDLNTLDNIDFINVVEDSDLFSFDIKNRTDPTKADYNKVDFRIMGNLIHESRIAWLCNDFYPANMTGLSIIDIIYDAISAQDSALWSVSTMVQDMATKVFKSDLIRSMSKEKITELLIKLKRDVITNSAMAVGNDEDYQKLIHNIGTGMRDIFDFIFDNLAGVSHQPKNILLGKAHGVVTAGEYDTLNYYADIATDQENDVRPIIERVIDMIVHERKGETFRAIGGDVESLDWDFEFNTLWKLDPQTQADADLKNSQRDQIDIDCGKIASTEARTLDPRMDNLEDFRQDPLPAAAELLRKLTGAPGPLKASAPVSAPGVPTPADKESMFASVDKAKVETFSGKNNPDVK